ncbi:hypothetical protein [Apilactobacillus timberlakei]|uniref:Uncharacterized protein n=1 Tax=Apilactobacillus timberlakei TaxID=2008380 RepID=A0ABY2YWD0_9LACO|nr:hypothetical protein [Apilactobacillus timberlakei]TPR12751.1 hypothetical protein DY048_06995 [Apilactobacillus timberlakei]TPR13634.1 hypothetical protein DY052_07865 [Apilactobacillus timberlakei]
MTLINEISPTLLSIVLLPVLLVISFYLFMENAFYIFAKPETIKRNLMNKSINERMYIYEEKVKDRILYYNSVSVAFIINGSFFTCMYVVANNESIKIYSSGKLESYFYIAFYIFITSIIVQFIRKYVRKKLFIIFHDNFNLDNFRLK